MLARTFQYPTPYSIYQIINCQIIFIHHFFNTNKLINLSFRPFKQFRTKPQNICRYLQYSLNLLTLIIAPIPLKNSAVPFIATTTRLFRHQFHHLVSNHLFHNQQKTMHLFPYNKRSMNQKNIVYRLFSKDRPFHHKFLFKRTSGLVRRAPISGGFSLV